jgi:hypothetical protein
MIQDKKIRTYENHYSNRGITVTDATTISGIIEQGSGRRGQSTKLEVGAEPHVDVQNENTKVVTEHWKHMMLYKYYISLFYSSTRILGTKSKVQGGG